MRTLLTVAVLTVASVCLPAPMQAQTALNALPAPAFPLKASANGRFLTDNNGAPFLLMGDSPQSMIANLTPADMATYLADRQRLGFNAILTDVLCTTYTGGNSNGTALDGTAPFTSGGAPETYDLSTPNPAYFSQLDALVSLAASHNIAVLLDPIETGGWLVTLQNNGMLKAFNFGAYLGRRYARFPNVVWHSGNDFQSWTNETDNKLVHQVMAGIASADPARLQTVELDFYFSYSNENAKLRDVLSLDACYTYYETYDCFAKAYATKPVFPIFLTEANYEYENNTGEYTGLTGPYILREQAYWTLTSGGVGQLYGSHYTWLFPAGWQAFLDSPGALQIKNINHLFGTLPWQNLVPDTTHQVVTAGYGNYNAGNQDLPAATYCTTASVPGTHSLTYCPNPATLTVNLATFSAPIRARWYDPSNGTFKPITGSPFPNTGTHAFTTPGNNHDGDPDWVLQLNAAQ